MIQATPLEILRAQAVTPLVVLLASAPSANLVIPGPPAIVLLGVTIPTLSAIFGVVGVLLGQVIAPASTDLGWRRRVAVWIALTLIVLTIVIATGQLPLVALAWGIGLGFSGVTVMRTLGSQAAAGFKVITDAFFAAIVAKVGGKETEK